MLILLTIFMFFSLNTSIYNFSTKQLLMFEAIHSKETIRQLEAVAITFLARQKFADDLKKKNKSYIFIYISIPINQKNIRKDEKQEILLLY